MTETQNLTQLSFIPDYSSKHYELFEVDPSLLDGIMNGNQTMKIKSYQQGMIKTAALCSNDATYKLKKSETSNTLFVVGLTSGQIYKQTSITVDLERTQTNKWQVAKVIMQYPLFSNTEEGQQEQEIQAISREQILKSCQISEGELNQVLQTEEKFEFYITETYPGKYSFFDPLSLYQLVDSLMIFINQQQELVEIDAEFILLNHDGIINDKFTQNSKIIDYALNFIADRIEGTDQFTLNKQKIVKSISHAMLYVKGDFYLGEFINALKHALDIAMPSFLQNQDQLMEDVSIKQTAVQDPASNLFEYYQGYDLSFLKGSAIIIPVSDLKMAQKQDDVIRLLHPYYSGEFDYVNGSLEKRLEALFEIKDKWTHQELAQYLKKFVEIGVSFDTYLMKNVKMIKEKNPFDSSKDIAYYMKKF